MICIISSNDCALYKRSLMLAIRAENAGCRKQQIHADAKKNNRKFVVSARAAWWAVITVIISIISSSTLIHSLTHLESKCLRFLPARRYASAGYSDRNVSVCPSVCPSRAGIVSKRRKLASWFLHHLVAPRLKFSDAKFDHQILRGSPRTGASNKGRSETFSDFLALSVYISKTVADTAKVTISD